MSSDDAKKQYRDDDVIPTGDLGKDTDTGKKGGEAEDTSDTGSVNEEESDQGEL